MNHKAELLKFFINFVEEIFGITEYSYYICITKMTDTTSK